MPLFSAGQVKIESGSAGTMVPVDRVTSINVGYNIPRANVGVMNRSKPLAQRPVINYTPVEVSLDFYKANKDLETSLGIINSYNVLSGITETRAGISSAAVRNVDVYFAPSNSLTYNGLLNVRSGVLTTYSIQGSVGEPVKGNISLQCFDMTGSFNNSARDSSNYNASLVKPENIALTGIQFTGIGLTGVTIQSFSFSLGLNRTQVFEIGKRLPVERPLTDANASLQVQGFFEGINNSIPVLSNFVCGDPMDGELNLTLTPSCVTNPSSTNINIIRPYFDSFSVQGQAGGFSTFSLSLSAPIGANPNETTDGSVVKIT